MMQLKNISRRYLWGALVMIVIAAAFSFQRTSAAQPRKYRALFHLTQPEPEKWKATLRNVKNLREALGSENVEIEVVMNSNGIGMALQSNTALAGEMKSYVKSGVRIVACSNTLREKNIPREQVLPFIEMVPSGVAEVVKKQHEGYAYIKAAW